MKVKKIFLLCVIALILSGCSSDSKSVRIDKETSGETLSDYISAVQSLGDKEVQQILVLESTILYDSEAKLEKAECRVWLLREKVYTLGYYEEGKIICENPYASYEKADIAEITLDDQYWTREKLPFRHFANQFDDINWSNFLTENKIGTPLGYEVYFHPGEIAEFAYSNNANTETRWYIWQNNTIRETESYAEENYYLASENGEIVYLILPRYESDSGNGEYYYANAMVLKYIPEPEDLQNP